MDDETPYSLVSYRLMGDDLSPTAVILPVHVMERMGAMGASLDVALFSLAAVEATRRVAPKDASS
jgi:hypothetical protein